MSRLLTCLALAATSAAASAQDFTALVASQPQAALYQANGDALNARLALIDNTPSGGKVKVATFVFDYGQAVQKLAGHMCKAAARGVQVELVADAKSGDRVDADDAFDSSNEAKSSEEIYQLLANCGVKVSIHNQDHGYVTVSILGQRLPNIFNGVPNGSSVSPIKLLSRINEIKAKLVQLVRPRLLAVGVTADPTNLINNVQALAMAIAGFTSEGGIDPNANRNIGSAYRAILGDRFWDQMNPERMTVLTEAIRDALQSDPDLSNVYVALRRHNRLNHRKIFLAQSASGEGCAFIGGRNLGDHYLVNSKENFRDGDVLVCSAQAGGLPVLSAIEESFDQLNTDFSDPILDGSLDNRVRIVKANGGYRYKFIQPASVMNVTTLAAIPAGIALPKFEQPALLMTKWQPSTDEVRMSLLEGISREQKEIYIETAYAEFNASIRRALEKALDRGVKVRVVTNSFFILDGPSKMIRLWMSHWNGKMAAKYPKLFTTYYATEEAGHMIHIKTAGFRCQKGLNGLSRMYIIGSHNFHPRSGYSDKENSLQWREQTNASCDDSQGDLIDQRIAYWNVVAKGTNAPVLDQNTSLFIDLVSATRLNSKGANGRLAQALMQAMYRENPKRSEPDLFQGERLQTILDLIESGGLRDLVGVLL